MQNRIDPLFNNKTLKPTTKEKIKVESALIAANERAPVSNGKSMQLVEGAYKGQSFQMWIDVDNRLAIPVKA
ncbi:MAG: hypothetical protein KGH75_09840 [Rhodospirillales bacterium]|nr:hypothetical protein [Rhodospirillales bacterium]